MLKPIIRGGQVNAWKEDFVNPKCEVAVNMINAMTKVAASNPASFDGFWLSALQFPLSGMESTIEKLASNVTIPVLLCFADKDTLISAKLNEQRWSEIFQKQRGENTSLTVKVYKDSAHGFFIEKFEDVNKDIIAFISSVAC